MKHPKHGLTDQQIRFCEAYMLEWNATKAYRQAYPKVKNENSAATSASKLLRNPKIEAHINELRHCLEKVAGISALKVLLELKKMAFTDLSDLFDEDGALKSLSGMTRTQKGIIREIKIKTTLLEGGEHMKETTIKAYGKVQAIAEINKMLGYYASTKHEHVGKIKVEQITGMAIV